ncbi:hypothetical protein Tco_1493648 [Tanacetum coccineum]
MSLIFAIILTLPVLTNSRSIPPIINLRVFSRRPLTKQRKNDDRIKSPKDMIEFSRNATFKLCISCLECYREQDDDEESTIPLNEIISQIPPSIAITPSSVEDLVLIPRESEDTFDSDKDCDLPFCDNSVIFSNPLFDANDDFTSSDDESLPEEDVPKENFKIYSNPLFEFDEEYISSDINPLYNKVLEDIENKGPLMFLTEMSRL